MTRAGRWRSRSLSMFLLGMLSLLSATARGELIRFAYAGTTDWTDPSTGIAAGARFSGTFAFDPASGEVGPAPDGSDGHVIGRPEPAGQTAPNAAGLTLEVGGHPVYTLVGGLTVAVPGAGVGLSNINISNSYFEDQHYLVNLGFYDGSRSDYPTPDLPAMIRLVDFSSSSMSAYEWLDPHHERPIFHGTIDTLTPIPTPEPATATLLVAAIMSRLGRPTLRRSTGPRGT